MTKIATTAMNTMAYLVLRMAYADAVEEKPECAYPSCDLDNLFIDVYGEVEMFLEDLDREGNTRERSLFFDYLTDEMVEGVYLESPRYDELGMPKAKQPEYFWKNLKDLV